MSTHELRSIPDDELLQRLWQLLTQSRRVESEIVAHIGEVDERRLYAGQACSSMFTYCTEILHLSEGEAYLRIAAARASRRHPMLLAMLRDGRLHLSGVGKLAPHLTDSNCETVLAGAANKSKREIEELVATLAPKPDVPPSIRKLPDRPSQTPPPPPSTPSVELRPGAVKFETPPAPSVVEVLATARYKVSFTASRELREKLERLQALLHGDLAAVIGAAVTEKLERLDAKRYAETKSPRKTLEETDTSPKGRYMPAALRRFVCERDGNQCTFVDASGRRCTERRGLEFHHRDPYGLGGDHSPDNVCLMCHAHNAYLAELDYGRETMDKYRRRDRVSDAVVEYFVAAVRPGCNAASSLYPS
jgi:hypothetical protein